MLNYKSKNYVSIKSVNVKFSDGSSAVPKTKDGCFSKDTSRMYFVLTNDKTVVAFANVISWSNLFLLLFS